MLEVKNVTKTFRRPGSKTLEKPLDGVSFTVGEGEIVGLAGKSGEGKSTIARLLCGTLKPDSGSASFGGEPLFDEAGYNRRAGFRIQIIPQQPFSALDPKQRLGDAVIEPMLCHKLVRSRSEAQAEVKRLFADVLLDEELLARTPSQVSGGQAQRVSIARVLAVGPKLLIADEATSMLDMVAQAQIIGILRSLVKSKGISIILISHDPELVAAVCNRRYLLSGGKLNEIGEER